MSETKNQIYFLFTFGGKVARKSRACLQRADDGFDSVASSAQTREFHVFMNNSLSTEDFKTIICQMLFLHF